MMTTSVNHTAPLAEHLRVIRDQFYLPILIGALTVVCCGSAAFAQSIDFEVDNVSLEQIAVMKSAETFIVPEDADSQVQSNIVLQRGEDNTATTGTIASPGAATVVLQGGNRNQSVAIIENSPRSVIGQVQLGSDNLSVAAIQGGSDNTIATAQVGNNLGLAAGLQDSTGATLIFGQGGENYNGAVVFRNAPPGTVIRVGD